MILYPTETLYALGVNALDSEALMKLFSLKERDERQTVSWLVRNMEDIEKYAELPPKAAKIAEQFLPGQLTLVLRAKDTVPQERSAPDKTVGLRISSDPIAQRLIAEYMEKHNAPLTCTSANVSGLSTLGTPSEILQQFGAKANMVTKIMDDGPRKGLASTVVRVIGDIVEVLREGEISEEEIQNALK
jgi:L-threonylcarbamoyladenylate synthase